MRFDPNRDYPLGANRPELVTTPGGIPLARVTLEAARKGEFLAHEIRATPQTLAYQADIARAAGRSQLAENLERAGELAAVPDELLIETYTALRPGRATTAELEEWASRLADFGAVKTAAFVREAAAAYAERGLLADG
jgi:propanediol dehydratase small subunit